MHSSPILCLSSTPSLVPMRRDGSTPLKNAFAFLPSEGRQNMVSGAFLFALAKKEPASTSGGSSKCADSYLWKGTPKRVLTPLEGADTSPASEIKSNPRRVCALCRGDDATHTPQQIRTGREERYIFIYFTQEELGKAAYLHHAPQPIVRCSPQFFDFYEIDLV